MNSVSHNPAQVIARKRDGNALSAEEIRACERLLEGRIPLMGVVLNRAQDFSAGRYRYAKG